MNCHAEHSEASIERFKQSFEILRYAQNDKQYTIYFLICHAEFISASHQLSSPLLPGSGILKQVQDDLSCLRKLLFHHFLQRKHFIAQFGGT